MSEGRRVRLRRECACGEPYEIGYLHVPGQPPSITYPSRKQCPSCGRYRNDPARRRGGRFDSRYERD